MIVTGGRCVVELKGFCRVAVGRRSGLLGRQDNSSGESSLSTLVRKLACICVKLQASYALLTT